VSPLGDNWHPIHVGEEAAPPEPAVPPSPPEMIKEAGSAFLSALEALGVPAGVEALVSYYAGEFSAAAIEAAERAAAAERERITLALLGCVTCGQVHEWREIPPQPGDHEGYPRHTFEDPGDGHPYRAAWCNRGGRSLADLIGAS